MHILLYLMSLKLVEHKVIDHKPLPLPPSCLGGVHHQVATDLCILVTRLHLWRGEGKRMRRRRGGEMEMEDGGGIRDRQKEGEKRKGGRREKEREADREQNFVCLLATENVMSCKEDRYLCPYLPEDRGHVDLLLTTHNP